MTNGGCTYLFSHRLTIHINRSEHCLCISRAKCALKSISYTFQKNPGSGFGGSSTLTAFGTTFPDMSRFTFSSLFDDIFIQ